MIQLIQAESLNLIYLEEKFGLTQADDDEFFPEWFDDLPKLSDTEKQHLDRVKLNYLSLIKRRPLAEELVKMVVLSPLLDLAGFYLPPFYVEAETSVEIYAEDEEKIIKGRIDLLLVIQHFWLVAIESRQASFSLISAIPQALACMLSNPQPEQPAYGLVMNGCDFIFLKLNRQGASQYALSDQFTLLKRENELYKVLGVLKNISQVLRN